jgi:hypothetical protein
MPTNEENRRTIELAVEDYMADPQGRMLGVKGSPGVGKTTVAYETLFRHRYNSIYLAPMHRIITENITMSQISDYGTLHLKGKTLSCVNPEIRNMLQTGAYFDVSPLCENCNYRGDCEHYEVLRKIYSNPQPWASVHSYIPLLLPDYLDKCGDYFDCVVVDENPLQYLLVQKAASEAQLAELQRVINTFPDCRERDFFSLLIDLLVDGYRRKDLDYTAMLNLYNTNLRLRHFSGEWKKHVLIEYINHHILSIPIDIVEVLCNIFSSPGRANMRDMIFIVDDEANNRRYLSFNYFDHSALLNIHLPIIYLDGSLNWDLTRFMFGREVQHVELTFKLENIYQLSSGRYPLSSWKWHGKMQSTARKRLLPLIRSICVNKENNVLIVCTKAIQNIITEYLAQVGVTNYRFANFYGLKGQNSFMQSCDTVIIAMMPSPPVEQLRSFQNLSGVQEEIWRDVLIKEEILQGIGRLRQNIKSVGEREREPMEIYILTSLELGFDNYVEYGEMVKHAMKLDNLPQHIVLANEMVELLDRPMRQDEILNLKQNWTPSMRMKAFNHLIDTGAIARDKKLRKYVTLGKF